MVTTTYECQRDLKIHTGPGEKAIRIGISYLGTPVIEIIDENGITEYCKEFSSKLHVLLEFLLNQIKLGFSARKFFWYLWVFKPIFYTVTSEGKDPVVTTNLHSMARAIVQITHYVSGEMDLCVSYSVTGRPLQTQMCQRFGTSTDALHQYNTSRKYDWPSTSELSVYFQTFRPVELER